MSLGRFVRLAVAASLCCTAPAVAGGDLTIATVVGTFIYDKVYPLQAIAYPPNAVHPAQYDGLTERGENNVLAPALALSWRAESETVWVFELRPDVKFSNGEPFDAAAAKATFDYVMSEEGRALSIFREMSSVRSAEARAALTLAVTTSRPDPMLPQKLVSLKMLPPGYFAQVGVAGFNKKPVGTGPFVETERSMARVVYKANKTSWRPPKLDSVTLVGLPVNTTRVQALAANQVDVALDIALEEAPMVTEAGGKLLTIPSGSVDVLQFNTSKPSPLTDRRVRQALNYAVDKDRIVNQLLNGLTRVATQYASKGTFGFDDSLTQPYPYNPEKARALLAEAGHPNGFDLPIELMQSVMTAPFEQAASDWNEVGVRAKLTTITVPTYSAHYYQNTWKGLAFYGGYNAAPSFDAIAPLRLHSCLWTNAWFCDREITDTVVRIDGIFDLERRATETRALMARLNTEAPALLLYDGFKITALGPRVKRFDSPNGYIRFDTFELTE